MASRHDTKNTASNMANNNGLHRNCSVNTIKGEGKQQQLKKGMEKWNIGDSDPVLYRQQIRTNDMM